jgi:hypothetical protein
MGTDFSREAKAKPLYARFKVTDHEPDDLPDCEQTQATFLDGTKNYGGDSARIIRYMSLFGSKSTSSHGVDMDAMFASKNTGVFVFFGSPSNEGVKGFDNIDSTLMNAMQGLGGALSDEAMIELKEMIQSGNLSPEALSLIENLSELSQLQEAMLTPDAVENAEVKLSDLTQKISEQIAQGIESGALPSSIISATVDVLADIAQSDYLSSTLDNVTTQNLLADNDNPDTAAEITEIAEIESLIEQLTELSTLEGLDQAAIDSIVAHIEVLTQGLADGNADRTVLSDIKTELSDLASQEGLPDTVYDQISNILPVISAISVAAVASSSIIDQLPELAELGAAELLEVLQSLSQAENIPPELQEMLDQIDIDNLTPQTLADALSVKAEGDLAQNVQALVIALNNPEIQNALPQETLDHVSSFLESHSALAEAVSTHVVVQNLETVLETIASDAPEAQDVQKIINDLKSGAESINTVDITVLQTAALQLDSATSSALENTVINNSVNNDKIITLNEATLQNLEAMTYSEILDADVKKDIAALLEKPNDRVLIKVVQEGLGDSAPPQIIRAFSGPVPIAAVASELNAIMQASTPNIVAGERLAPAQKVQVEALKSAVSMLENLSGNEMISPAQAEVLLRKMNDGSVAIADPVMKQQFDQIREQIIDRTIGGQDAIPKDVVEGPCKGCAGGDCGNCGPKYNLVAKLQSGTPSRTADFKGSDVAMDKAALRDVIKAVKPANSNIFKAVEKAPVEALESAIRMINVFEQNNDTTMSPERVEVILRKIDEGFVIVKDPDQIARIEQLREDVLGKTEGGREKVPKDVREGRCKGCAGGSCASCGPNYKLVAKEPSEKPAGQTAAKGNSKIANFFKRNV